MKTINELLAEVEIRFGKNWWEKEIEDIIASPLDWANVGISHNDDDGWMVSNKHGWLLKNSIWATAKITEKPEKWVVEKDESHPMWNDFKSFYFDLMVKNGGNSLYLGDKYFDIMKYFADDGATSRELHGIETPSQYLTLDQWAKLFSDEPKEGDWCLFWDISTEMPVVDVLRYNTCTGFGTVDGSLWKNCQKLSPELTEMLTKEINQIKEK